jgi:hypothetical protein
MFVCDCDTVQMGSPPCVSFVAAVSSSQDPTIRIHSAGIPSRLYP